MSARTARANAMKPQSTDPEVAMFLALLVMLIIGVCAIGVNLGALAAAGKL